MATSKQRKNRQQRRKRQQAGGDGPRPQQTRKRILFPNGEQPVLEVHIAPGTSREAEDMCTAYWAFSEPGAWDRKVSELGVAHQVLKQVKAASHVSLLTLLCPGCGSPSTAASRSEVQATAFWRDGVVPTGPVETRTLCTACRDAAAASQAEEQAAAKAAEEKRHHRRLDNASTWMSQQKDRKYAEEDPDTLGTLTVLAMADIMERTEKDTIGPLGDGKFTLTGSLKSDVDVLADLYVQRWVMPTLPAALGNFDFNDDDTVSGVYIAQVPWALAGWLGPGSEARDTARDCMHATLNADPDQVRDAVLDLETGIAVDYLQGLLARKYREEPIPEHRLPDAHATIRAALDGGFTLGQIVAVCWSAAAGSVAWGQRTPGLKPGSVSAATVTNLERRIGYAKDRPVVEYDLPNWVNKPAAHATALRWLEKHDAAAAAAAETMTAFRALHQRINNQPLDAIELADDLADRGPNFANLITRLENRQSKTEDTGTPVTFVLVRPDGTMTVESATVRGMRRLAGEPNSMTDRLPVEGTRGLIALIPVFADRDVHPFNTVAAAMLELLGAGEGAVSGNVVFCRTDDHNRLGGLTDDLRTLVELAHEVSYRSLTT